MKCTHIQGSFFSRSGQEVGALTQSHCTRMRTYIKLFSVRSSDRPRKVIKKIEVVVRLMVNRKLREKNIKKYGRTIVKKIWKSNMQCVPFVAVVVVLVVLGHVPIISSFIFIQNDEEVHFHTTVLSRQAECRNSSVMTSDSGEEFW